MERFIKINKYYLIGFLALLLVFMLCKVYLGEYILNIDLRVGKFINKVVVSDKFTSLFKILTYLGSAYVLIFIVLLTLFIKDKSYFINTSLSLAFTFTLSVIYKNFIKRTRPNYSLIGLPSDYSFPSGHTMCSTQVYCFLIYLVNKNIKNKYIKVALNILFSIVILLVGMSRLYLGVHYLSDVLFGYILGFMSVACYINYVRKEEIL